MEISHIVPVPLLDLIPKECKTHLVLAHLCEEHIHYLNFYREKAIMGHTIILDNSNFELGDDAFTADELMKIGERVKATYIMAPEYYKDARRTVEAMKSFLEELDRERFKAFGTIHGRNLADITYCLSAFLEVVNVEAIGFSCRLDPPEFDYIAHPNPSFNMALRRYSVICHVEKHFDLEREDAHFHLLGLNSPIELTFRHPIIRSCDSSAAYIYALHGLDIESIFTKKPSTKVDFNDHRGRSARYYIGKNMALLEGLTEEAR
jgi:hypothetical protein